MTTTTKAPRKPFQRAPKDQPTVTRSNHPDGQSGAVIVKAVAPIEGLTIGGEPRVHLLPPQVLARKKNRAIRRRLGLGVVGVLVLVGLAAGLAEVDSISAQSALTSAQAQTISILEQQAKYNNVLKVKADSASILSAQQSATTQEILWKPFLLSFQKTLPADASISSLSASITDSASSASASSTSGDPLQDPYIATVTGSLTMKQSEVSAWLNSLAKLKGFVDATPDSVTAGSGSGSGSTGAGYTVAFTMHLNSDALANRFSKAAGTSK